MNYNAQEGLNKLQNSYSRHTQGQASHFWRRPESSQNNCLLGFDSCVALPPASMQSWMLVFTSMTNCVFEQRFLNWIPDNPYRISGMTDCFLHIQNVKGEGSIVYYSKSAKMSRNPLS